MPMGCGQKVWQTEATAPQESGKEKADSWTKSENSQKELRT